MLSSSFLKKMVDSCLPSAGKIRLLETQTTDLSEDPNVFDHRQPVIHPASKRIVAKGT